jgi:hypothetical protein
MVKDGETNPDSKTDLVQSKHHDNKIEKNLSNVDTAGKMLIIKRKVLGPDGLLTVETETIKKPEVVEAYLKIKASKTDEVRN